MCALSLIGFEHLLGTVQVTNDNIPSRMRPSDGGLLFGLSGKQEVLDSEQLGLQGVTPF